MALIVIEQSAPKIDDCVHHIIDNLFLGTCDSRTFIGELDIDRVIEIGESQELENYHSIQAEKLSIVMADNRKSDISRHFSDVMNFIGKNEKNVLIHCKMGVSRSVSFVVYYLMTKHSMSLDNSIKYIDAKRNSKIYTHPNIGFMRLLGKIGI